MFSWSKNSTANLHVTAGGDLLTEYFDFSEDAFGIDDVGEGRLNLFNRHLLSCLVVLGRVDNSVGPAAYHVGHFVPIIDNDIVSAYFEAALPSHRWVEQLSLCQMSTKTVCCGYCALICIVLLSLPLFLFLRIIFLSGCLFAV